MPGCPQRALVHKLSVRYFVHEISPTGRRWVHRGINGQSVPSTVPSLLFCRLKEALVFETCW